MRRPAVVLLYLVILAGETMWTAIVPLVPRFSDRFQLSAFEAGVLLASTSVAVLLVSIPAGMVGDRLGTRRLTLLALGVMVLADLGQGLAGSFPALLGARLLFGVAFGILWTSGIAWLSELAGGRRGQALSLTVTTAGIGGVTGPAFAGVLVDRYGLASPFVVAAGVTALLLVALLAESSGSGRAVVSQQTPGSMLRAATGDRRVVTSLLLMGTAGFCGSVVNLLVPLQLHRNGVSTAAIGGAFAGSAAVFIACSALAARLGDRAARVRVGAVALLLLAFVVLLPVVDTSTTALAVFLIGRAPMTAILFTITFPLGVAGARAAGIGVSAVAALLNVVWSVSVLGGPLLAGAMAQTVGSRAAYLVLIALAVTVAAWIGAVPGEARSAAVAAPAGPDGPARGIGLE